MHGFSLSVILDCSKHLLQKCRNYMDCKQVCQKSDDYEVKFFIFSVCFNCFFGNIEFDYIAFQASLL